MRRSYKILLLWYGYPCMWNISFTLLYIATILLFFKQNLFCLETMLEVTINTKLFEMFLVVKYQLHLYPKTNTSA